MDESRAGGGGSLAVPIVISDPDPTPASSDAVIEDCLRLPPPGLDDFEDDIPGDERSFCVERFSDLNAVKHLRMHCTACGTHLGLCAHNATKLRMHPKLKTMVCSKCLEFYNSGEFDRGEDGSELYCRWCGQGGQVYCCSNCPVVFCQKCIKRNFGPGKISDIESIDDWSCFLCNPKTLWCHRAALWAAKRYLFWKNKLSLPECAIDESICCKKKTKCQNPGKIKTPVEKFKTIKIADMQTNVKEKSVGKISPTNNVGKTPKRVNSPLKFKKIIKALESQIEIPPPLRKIVPKPLYTPKTAVRFNTPIADKRNFIRKPSNPFNAFQNGNMFFPNQPFPRPPVTNDNINLSLESLTQGLDVSQLNSNVNLSEDDGSVICTPDFPMPIEPICNIFEDMQNSPLRIDDDVQIVNPAPMIVPKPISELTNPPGGIDLNPFNIIQMTEEDVTINKRTGGLRFRIDPSTLSSSKTYKLPDGRVFSVNPNPSMPGGFSATIITLNEQIQGFMKQPELTLNPSLGQLPMIHNNQLGNPVMPVNMNSHSWTIPVTEQNQCQKNATNVQPNTSSINTNDIIINTKKNKTSIEWYSYNLYEAVDLMTYVTKKLKLLKKEHPPNLRNKSVAEIEQLHYILDKLLKISSQRFTDLRTNLNKEFEQWLKQNKAVKSYNGANVDSVLSRFLNCTEDLNDEPIFIDENSDDSSNPVIVNKETNISKNPIRVKKGVPFKCLNDDLKRSNPLKNIDPLQIKVKKISLERPPGNNNADVEDVLSYSTIINNRVDKSNKMNHEHMCVIAPVENVDNCIHKSNTIENHEHIPTFASMKIVKKYSSDDISHSVSSIPNIRIQNLENSANKIPTDKCLQTNEDFVDLIEESADITEEAVNSILQAALNAPDITKPNLKSSNDGMPTDKCMERNGEIVNVIGGSTDIKNEETDNAVNEIMDKITEMQENILENISQSVKDGDKMEGINESETKSPLNTNLLQMEVDPFEIDSDNSLSSSKMKNSDVVVNESRDETLESEINNRSDSLSENNSNLCEDFVQCAVDKCIEDNNPDPIDSMEMSQIESKCN